MSSLRLAELVEDYAVYPRHAVDDANVGSLVSAIRSGAVLPPIVVEESTKRIVDGWHRARAYRRVLGPEGVVEVEEIDYPNEAELLLDAIRRNAAHGRKMDSIDQIRALQMCKARGIEMLVVAQVLHMPAEKVRKLEVRLASAPRMTEQTIPGTLSIALKRPVIHLAGKTLSQEQAEAHQRAPGVSYLLIANQLNDALRVEFINRGDDRLIAALKHLNEALTVFFSV